MKINRLKALLIMSFLFLVPFLMQAQDKKPNLEIHKISGREYYIHTIEKGNTLYEVSRMYAVPIKDLLKANPSAVDGYAIGDRILIPLKDVKRRDFDQTLEVDGNFLIHKVEKKNTLYAISKEYNVDQKDIIAENPEVVNGLKEGMELKIPVAKMKKTEQRELYVPAKQDEWQTHLVEPKETVYSLSKKYNVSIDSLLEVNNGLVGGLRVGETIKIPILKKLRPLMSTKDSVYSALQNFDSTNIKQTYNVALMLPFDLDRNASVANSSHNFGSGAYSIEFYEGVLIALDSLKKQGMNIKLMVYDTQNDSSVTAQILKKPEFTSTDLIIGPLFYKNFVKAADYAKKNGINIVSPVKQSNKILLGNPYVSKVATSSPLLVKELANYSYKYWKRSNLILLNHQGEDDDSYIQTFIKTYKEITLASKDSTMHAVPTELIYGDKSWTNLKNNLSEVKNNIIYIPSENQAFITTLLNALYGLSSDYQITLIFNDNIRDYDNIELSYLQKLNVHVLTSEYINNESEAVKNFKKTFHTKYNHLPSKFSYLGYDVAYYYLNLLDQFGVNYNAMFLGYKQDMLMLNFDFFKTGIESGFENHSVFLLKYKDFNYEKVF